jgi:hypothetical protein
MIIMKYQFNINFGLILHFEKHLKFHAKNLRAKYLLLVKQI